MTPQTVILLLALTFCQTFAWEGLPSIPSGRRSQYYALHSDGGYKYGYDTGDGYFAKQFGDSANQVSGHYGYKNKEGQNVDLRYTAGVEGFRPEGFDQAVSAPSTQTGGSVTARIGYSGNVQAAPVVSSVSSSQESSSSDETSGDASYSFNIDTDNYKRQEASDSRGNIQGSYSYVNEAGVHDLSYTAGENTGFVATSGSLSRANGLKAGQTVQGSSQGQFNSASSGYQRYSGPSASSVTNVNPDGSYTFSYSTGDSSRQESADSSNNVQGSYSYQNEAGTHDLRYVAGAKTGFVATGGSLAQQNGQTSSSHSAASSVSTSRSSVGSVVAPQYSRSQTYSSPAASSVTNVNPDGSYSFSYSAGDSSRQESADSSNNVQGAYSYQNEAGTHDLRYVAGAKTGFLPTGGSLAQPNGFAAGRVSSNAVSTYSAAANFAPVSSVGSVVAPQYSRSQTHSTPAASSVTNVNPDGSYSFSYSTGDSSRQESADASNNVQGVYSYQNEAGTHDLSYVAGAKTGFVATGGSLAQSSGVATGRTSSTSSSSSSSESQIDQARTGDASYNFNFDTGDHRRQESSDASGNVQGRYSYTNAAGTHDLSYVAGSQTGFLPTGGSLATPQIAVAAAPSFSGVAVSKSAVSGGESYDDQADTGDASYSFNIDTDDYKRQEVSDARGNVQGSYSYRNAAGNHDLSYTAGAGTGFVATGGSLANLNAVASIPSGVSNRVGPSFRQSFSSEVSPSVSNTLIGPSVKTSYSLGGNSVVHAYLPPTNNKGKFGYIFDTV